MQLQTAKARASRAKGDDSQLEWKTPEVKNAGTIRSNQDPLAVADLTLVIDVRSS